MPKTFEDFQATGKDYTNIPVDGYLGLPGRLYHNDLVITFHGDHWEVIVSDANYEGTLEDMERHLFQFALDERLL